MKKILITILIILLLVLGYFALAKGIGFLNIKSINNIKEASQKLETDFSEANELSNKTYPVEVEGLEEAIKKLKISKQEYENKKLYNPEENSVGTITVKEYKIHYLWTILGNYRKNSGVQSLSLDLKSTELEDIYDLEFTLVGPYTNIIDFLYEIENDEELNFEIQKLEMVQYSSKTTIKVTDEENPENNKTQTEYPFDSVTDITSSSADKNTEANEEGSKSETIYDPKWVETSFTVEDIGITLD